ncbi:hypothetical protein ACTVJH_01285 [Desulfoplanes sp. PS50]
MGAHDNEEIIDLTDVIEEPIFSESSSQKTSNFSPEQAIDSRDLEDEFEQLLQGAGSSQDNGNGGEVNDDLDIESLFEEMEQSPSPQEPDAEDPLNREKRNPPVHFSEDSTIEDMSDIEDIFASMDDDTTKNPSSAPDQELEDLLSEEEPLSESETESFLVEDESSAPEADSEQSVSHDQAASSAPESPSLEETSGIEATLSPDEESIEASLQETESPIEDATEEALQETESPIEDETEEALQEAESPVEDETEAMLHETESPDEDETKVVLQEAESSAEEVEPPFESSLETRTDEPAGAPATTPADQTLVEELQERIAALENRPQKPDQETMFAMLSAFFQDNEHGADILNELTERVTAQVQETAKQLVEKKLDALDVPSSEEITAMVKEEISASVAENLPAPADTRSIVQEIREDLQKKVQEGMDAWEAERIALRSDIDALRTEPLDKQTVIREIREDLEQRVQEGMDAWESQRMELQKEIDQLRSAHSGEPDSAAIVRAIREDLQQRVQEGMDAWEAQRISLNQEINELKDTMTQTSSREQARIDKCAASMVTREDLQAIKEDLQANISREIPGVAAKVIREEIAALMK